MTGRLGAAATRHLTHPTKHPPPSRLPTPFSLSTYCQRPKCFGKPPRLLLPPAQYLYGDGVLGEGPREPLGRRVQPLPHLSAPVPVRAAHHDGVPHPAAVQLRAQPETPDMPREKEKQPNTARTGFAFNSFLNIFLGRDKSNPHYPCPPPPIVRCRRSFSALG